MLEGLVIPFNSTFSFRSSTRLGRFITIPSPNNQCSSSIRNIIENSLAIKGGMLFNKLPENIRSLSNISVSSFKIKLDKYLTSIPDEPSITGYISQRAANSNSLLDQIPTRHGPSSGVEPSRP